MALRDTAAPRALALQAFVPARDFARSKAFYAALGFELGHDADGVASLHYGGCSFLLQDFFVAEHAANCVMHLGVDDADRWHEHVLAQRLDARFGAVVGEPGDRPWGRRDFTLVDPSGVLWRIGHALRRAAAVDYLNPGLPAGLKHVAMPMLDATDAALRSYGRLVEDRAACTVEIVRWPSQGWRPVDADTGDEGGTTEGVFVSEWRGDILYGRNEAVGGHYVLAYAERPELARDDHARPPRRMLLWHANYHPDGGQLFFPLDRRPFFVPLALPGDGIAPERFACFRFDGSQGLYIHPGVWHEGVFGLCGKQRFFDKQGAVHARVSVDFAREFGCLLEATIE